MSTLDLPRCPICHSQQDLLRQTFERGNQSFVWYECKECGSALLWAGDDRWVYQKIGREAKADLLKKTITSDELRHMAFESVRQERTSLDPKLEDKTTRRCPYCAETIEARAAVCQHCHRPVSGPTAQPSQALPSFSAPQALPPTHPDSRLRGEMQRPSGPFSFPLVVGLGILLAVIAAASLIVTVLLMRQPNSAQTQVSPRAGGQVQLGDGVLVAVKPGSVTEDATLTVAEVESAQVPLPPASGTLGPVYQVELDGEAPDLRAIVTLPYDPQGLSESEQEQIAIVTHNGGVWTMLPSTVDTDAHTVSAETVHFSLVAWFLRKSELNRAPEVNVIPEPSIYAGIPIEDLTSLDMEDLLIHIYADDPEDKLHGVYAAFQARFLEDPMGDFYRDAYKLAQRECKWKGQASGQCTQMIESLPSPPDGDLKDLNWFQVLEFESGHYIAQLTPRDMESALEIWGQAASHSIPEYIRIHVRIFDDLLDSPVVRTIDVHFTQDEVAPEINLSGPGPSKRVVCPRRPVFEWEWDPDLYNWGGGMQLRLVQGDNVWEARATASPTWSSQDGGQEASDAFLDGRWEASTDLSEGEYCWGIVTSTDQEQRRFDPDECPICTRSTVYCFRVDHRLKGDTCYETESVERPGAWGTLSLEDTVVTRTDVEGSYDRDMLTWNIIGANVPGSGDRASILAPGIVQLDLADRRYPNGAYCVYLEAYYGDGYHVASNKLRVEVNDGGVHAFQATDDRDPCQATVREGPDPQVAIRPASGLPGQDFHLTVSGLEPREVATVGWMEPGSTTGSILHDQLEAGNDGNAAFTVATLSDMGPGVYTIYINARGVRLEQTFELLAPEPSPIPSATATPPPRAESFSIMAAEALAPISILSRSEYPGETEDYSYMQFDVDQEGNVHILIHWGWDDDEEDEIYIVDGVVYARDSGVGEDDFAVVEDPEYLALLADPFAAVFAHQDAFSDDIFESFPLHAILWAGAYESVEQLGTETVNGFPSEEYRLTMDPMELSSLQEVWWFDDLADWIVLDQDNAVVDVWIEPTTGAVVKAEWQLINDEGVLNATLEVTPLGPTLFVPPVVESPAVTVEATATQIPNLTQLNFDDDFSTEKGWINDTGDAYYRDPANGWISWHASRSADAKYYMPIERYSGDFRLEARVKATAWAGNANLFFGLADDLTGCFKDPDWPTGLFVDMSYYGGYSPPTTFRAHAEYADREWYISPVQVPYTMNEWHRVVFTVTGLNWRIEVHDDAGNPLGEISGVFPQGFSGFDYVLLSSWDTGGEWPNGDGLLDDLVVTSMSYD